MASKTYTTYLEASRTIDDGQELSILLKSGQIELIGETGSNRFSNIVAVYISSQRIGHLVGLNTKDIYRALQKHNPVSVTTDNTDTDKKKTAIKLKVKFIFPVRTAPKLAPTPTCGIYLITVKSTSLVYIGQSNDINKRITTHWTDLELGTHSNFALQSEWNEGGAECLQVSILETSPNDLTDLELQRWLGNREMHWINYYRKTGKCMNVTNGEVVPTKHALEQFAVEQKSTNKKHNSEVRKRKKEIDEEISRIKTEIKPTLDKLKDIYYELNQYESKHKEFTGFFSLFKPGASEIAATLKQRIDELNTKSDQLNATIRPQQDKINELVKEYKTLKTIKQMERAGINSSNRFDRSVRMMGITMPSYKKPKIY